MHLFIICWFLSLSLLTLKSAKSELLGEVHTSTAYLSSLVEAEKEVVRSLRIFHGNCKKELDTISSYVSEWVDIPSAEYVEHPINSYHFLKRVVHQYKNVLKSIQNIEERSSKVLQDVKQIRSGFFPVTGQDISATAVSIAKLQDTYALSMKKLAKGTILNHKAYKGLTADDCFYYGEQTFQNFEFELSKLWTKKGLELLRKENATDPDKMIKEVKDIIKQRKLLAKLLEKASKSSDDRFISYLGTLGLPSTFAAKATSQKKKAQQIAAIDLAYKALCRGMNLRKKEDYQNKKLLCRYDSSHSKYHVLSPNKVEELLRAPPVMVYHNFLRTSEMVHIKNLTFPALKTSKLYSKYSHSVRKSSARIAKRTWLRKDETKTLQSILRRVETVTGLSTVSSEDYHVLNYGVGGHYELHTDSFQVGRGGQSVSDEGTVYETDRTATVLFYLNDVIAGGSTVFPYLNVFVPPRKGSALVWYNLHRNGQGDARTLHASCPVLLGQKWIANLWLHEPGQEFIRSCSLDPTA